jgi:hypothetical protein
MSFRWVVDECQQPQHCLDRLDFLDWMNFTFDHAPALDDEERWYYRDESSSYYFKDPLLVLHRAASVMENADLLTSRYKPAQIEQGFWCLISGFELSELLEDAELDFEPRRRCIAALEQLYLRLLRRPGFERLALDYLHPITAGCHERHDAVESDDQELVRELLLESCCGVLRMKERACFLGAARGLGRLRHPESARLLETCLEDRVDLGAQDINYARACLRGGLLPALPNLGLS